MAAVRPTVPATLNVVSGVDTEILRSGIPALVISIVVQVTTAITTAGTLIIRSGGSGGAQVYPSVSSGTAVATTTFDLPEEGIISDGLYLDITAATGGAGTWFVYYKKLPYGNVQNG